MTEALAITRTKADAVRIRIEGTFDFSVHKEFRRAYEGSVTQGQPVIVDLKAVDYIDSSALGMLLMLREYLGNERAEITLEVRSPEVKNILQVSNFDRLFHVR